MAQALRRGGYWGADLVNTRVTTMMAGSEGVRKEDPKPSVKSVVNCENPPTRWKSE